MIYFNVLTNNFPYLYSRVHIGRQCNIKDNYPTNQAIEDNYPDKFPDMISRIHQFIEHQGISIGAFEQKINASSGVIRKAIANNTDIQSKWLSNIMDNYPQLDSDWLLTGRGAMLKSDDRYIVSEKFPQRSDRSLESQAVPLYELEATAGLVALYVDTTAHTPSSYISIPDLPPCDGAIHVRGDSMYPILKSGDIVLYKWVRDMQYGILWGEMYIVSYNIDGDEYISIKYVQKSDDPKFIKLVSHNGHHATKEIPIEKVRAMALIKASVRYNTMG